MYYRQYGTTGHMSRRAQVAVIQYTVEQDDAEARHLLGPLLDDLSDGGPSTNRRGYVTET